MWLKTVGQNSPKYSITLSNLATLEATQGRHKQAKQLFNRCLEIDESSLGPSNPTVATDMANIAGELYHEKKYAQALDLYDRARQIDELSFGPASPFMPTIWRNIGIVYQTTKHFAEARDAYARAIHILETFSGSGRQLESCLRSYADVLRKLQSFSEAEEADLEASKIEMRSAIAAEKAQIKPELGFSPSVDYPL